MISSEKGRYAGMDADAQMAAARVESHEALEGLDGAWSLRVGIVVIGRNEGERLGQCLRSAMATRCDVVYVDSGSTDGSLELARQLQVESIALDTSRPFTAARGRNVGFHFLKVHRPDLAYVQFIDGDTELIPGWIRTGAQCLDAWPKVVAVCGRRRERDRTASVYHRLCDIEWDTPVGSAIAFGGDVMIRVDAFENAGGYDDNLVAGEDPEFALRLRHGGGEIVRLPADMTLHDVGLVRFGQWWQRSVRAGHAFAQCAHRRRTEGMWRREVRSNWLLGGVLPIVAFAGAVPTWGASVAVAIVAWLFVFMRVLGRARARGMAPSESLLFAAFTVLAKIPNALGQAMYWQRYWLRQPSQLIEYKPRRVADRVWRRRAVMHRGDA